MQGFGCKPLILIMICVISPLLANQDEVSEALPSAELLEYLGQLVELDEELIGPELFNAEKETEQSEETDENPATNEDKTPDEGENKHD